jgi:hypothetical protein
MVLHAKIGLTALLALCVTLLTLSILNVQSVSNLQSVTGFPGAPLKCLSQSSIEAIRNDPGQIFSGYSVCRDELSERLRHFGLDEWGLKAAFAAISAHAMAPYGNSVAVDLPILLREKYLDCDNYAALTGHFVDLLLPDHPGTFTVIGLQGKKIGNHAQVILRVAEEHRILADPTLGIIADIDYDALLSGRPVLPEKIQVFYVHSDPNIIAFGKTVYTAILSGSYLPSDLLYYFADMKSFLRFSHAIEPAFATPIDVDKIADALPTPGGVALVRQLANTPPKP